MHALFFSIWKHSVEINLWDSLDWNLLACLIHPWPCSGVHAWHPEGRPVAGGQRPSIYTLKRTPQWGWEMGSKEKKKKHHPGNDIKPCCFNFSLLVKFRKWGFRFDKLCKSIWKFVSYCQLFWPYRSLFVKEVRTFCKCVDSMQFVSNKQMFSLCWPHRLMWSRLCEEF